MHTPSFSSRIDSLVANVRITAIACGERHSLALGTAALGGASGARAMRPGSESNVYVWGCNNHGQLGLGTFSPSWEPHPLEALRGKRILSISAGAAHSLAITCLAHVYGWGATWAQQMGQHQHRAAQAEPALLADAFDAKVFHIVCGGHHSLLQVLPASRDSPFTSAGQSRGADAAAGALRSNASPSFLLAGPPTQQALELARRKHNAAASPGPTRKDAPANTALQSVPEDVETGGAESEGSLSVTASSMEPLGCDWGSVTRCAAAGYGWCGAVYSPLSLDLAVLQSMLSGEMEHVAQLRLLLRAALLPLKRKVTAEESLDVLGMTALVKVVDCFSAVWQTSCDLIGVLRPLAAEHQPGEVRLADIIESHPTLTVLRQYAVALGNAMALGLTRDPTVRRMLHVSLRETGSLNTGARHATDRGRGGKSNTNANAASAAPGDPPPYASEADSLPYDTSGGTRGHNAFSLGNSEQGMVKWLLSQPVEHMQLYIDLLGRLSAVLMRTQPEEAQRLARLSKRWYRLLSAVTQGTAMAGDTATFWQLHSNLRKNYGAPQRRLVTHSKEVPLSLKGVMASGTWVILFNDALLLVSVFSSRIYTLSTLWLADEAPDPRTGKEGWLRLEFPEDTVTLHTTTVKAHRHWRSLLHQTLRTLFVRGEAGMPTFSTNALDYRLLLQDDSILEGGAAPWEEQGLDMRYASYRYRAHSMYKECTYTGVWERAKPHGDGSLVCADGRRFMGEFRDGVCHGFATMQAPSDADDIEMATGAWRDGRLHGYATVLFHNGDKYVGEWRDGKRHGFGFCTYADGSVYHGEWLADLRHSYGVYNSGDRRVRFLGLWDHGHRHGSGALVKNGTYFEGNFFAGHMQGPGLLVTATGGTRAVAEFGNDALLQGRGSLWLADGHIFEGSLTGAWAQAGGVKLNGTLYSNAGALAPGVGRGEALLTGLDNLFAFVSDSDMFAPDENDEGDYGVIGSGVAAGTAFGAGGRAGGASGHTGTGYGSQQQVSGGQDHDDVHHWCQRRWRDVPADAKWAGLFARCKKEVCVHGVGGGGCPAKRRVGFQDHVYCAARGYHRPISVAPAPNISFSFFCSILSSAGLRAAWRWPVCCKRRAVCGSLIQLPRGDASASESG
jgi:hypothetical protein